LWKAKTPKGHSSPVVVQDRVWITGQEQDDRVVLCYDAGSGALLWRRAVRKVRNEEPHPLNGLATPTPVTDGRLIFVFFPDVGLLAYDLRGEEHWRTSLGPFSSIQGMAVSPVYAEGNVVL